MFSTTLRAGRAAGCIGLALLLAAPVQADSVEATLHKAYFLEHEQGDLEQAAALYAKVVSSADASAALRATATAGRNRCQEDIVSADFARLMPATSLVYAELNRPGAQLERLLDQLGLLRRAGEPADGDQIAISDTLLRSLFGVRGAAVALTGFDIQRGEPTGVAVLHFGQMEMARALINDMLPASNMHVDPIGGHPTYHIENEVFVTLTERLVVLGRNRGDVEGVIDRLGGDGYESLADNEQLAGALAGRDDALLFFCVNFKPILPMLQAAMAMGGSQEPGIAVAQALLDLKSLETIVGKAGVGDEGLYLDVGLNLAEGHRNLVFNFMRMPAIDRETLKRVPSGAAGFLTLALNESDSRYSPQPTGSGDEPPPVTFLDLGRELFANIVSVAAFAMPNAGETTEDEPIPGVAAVFTVRDPAKSKALWTQMLGIASLATGNGSMQGAPIDAGGAAALRFALPEGISIYFAAQDNEIIISPSRKALSAALKPESSIFEDEAFQASLARLDENATLALFAHPGRCLELGEPYMSSGDLREVEPFRDLLREMVASMVVKHSNRELRFSARVTGLPNVGPLVTKLIREEAHGPAFGAARSFNVAAPANPADGLTHAFVETARAGQLEAARQLADEAYARIRDDANALNSFAWEIAEDPDRYDRSLAEVASRFSRRSNELTEYENWMYVDTLAHARFMAGDVEAAVKLQRRAVELAGDHERRGEAEAALERFETALREQETEVASDAPHSL